MLMQAAIFALPVAGNHRAADVVFEMAGNEIVAGCGWGRQARSECYASRDENYARVPAPHAEVKRQSTRSQIRRRHSSTPRDRGHEVDLQACDMAVCTAHDHGPLQPIFGRSI